MERHIKSHCHKGISLLEIMVVGVIVATVLSHLISISVNRVNRANYEKTLSEMTSIAQACMFYYNSHNPNSWPSSTSPWVPTTVLVPKYLYHLVYLSPWGGNYEVTFQNNLVIVSTTIPSGIAQQNYSEGELLNVVPGAINDQISIAQSIPTGLSGRLWYDRKHS